MSEQPDPDATARVPRPGPAPGPVPGSGPPPGPAAGSAPPPGPAPYRPPPYPAPYGPPAGGPPYPPPSAYPSPYGQPPYPRRTNGSAVAALVLGILGFLFVPAILALVFGYTARRRIAATGEGGRGMATAGIVLGWIWLALAVYRLLTYLVGG